MEMKFKPRFSFTVAFEKRLITKIWYSNRVMMFRENGVTQYIGHWGI